MLAKLATKSPMLKNIKLIHCSQFLLVGSHMTSSFIMNSSLQQGIFK